MNWTKQWKQEQTDNRRRIDARSKELDAKVASQAQTLDTMISSLLIDWGKAYFTIKKPLGSQTWAVCKALKKRNNGPIWKLGFVQFESFWKFLRAVMFRKVSCGEGFDDVLTIKLINHGEPYLDIHIRGHSHQVYGELSEDKIKAVLLEALNWEVRF